MKRRNFLKSSLLSAGALSVAPGFLAQSPFYNEGFNKGFPFRTLGKTGLKVSVLGIGGWQAGTEVVPQDMANQMVERAFELGINYIDTAPNYGDSEDKLGIAVEGKRKDFIIATKTEEPDYDGTWRLMEESLKRLKTDYLDIVNLHSLGNLKRFPEISDILGPQGAWKRYSKPKTKK